MINLMHGDCLEVLRTLPDNSVDAVVTDPPYGLSFMGKRWDYDVPATEVWAECLRVLKPGGHLLAFAGTRTQHRMAVRIEDAGFEIRDMIAWVYGSGFPKSLDVSKAIDKQDAAEARAMRRFRFTEWMRGTGLTAARIDAITCTNMGNHYTTHPTQPAVPTREYFEMLRPYFGCEVPDWVEQMVDERTVESENFKRREVVGVREMRDTSEIRIAVTASATDYDAAARRAVVLTTAHTEAARQWQGWGTSLKPALEPITVARKPLSEGTVAANVLAHGTGAINVDGCRVGCEARPVMVRTETVVSATSMSGQSTGATSSGELTTSGRWPANLIHDGSEEVLAGFPVTSSAVRKPSGGKIYGRNALNESRTEDTTIRGFSDTGSAARFFYCAKASKRDRDEGLDGFEKHVINVTEGHGRGAVNTSKGGDGLRENRPRANVHPTVKPTDLMRYLVRLVTPPGGVVLDPFMGSGSTGKAARLEGFQFIGIEREAEYLEIARARINAVQVNLL